MLTTMAHANATIPQCVRARGVSAWRGDDPAVYFFAVLPPHPLREPSVSRRILLSGPSIHTRAFSLHFKGLNRGKNTCLRTGQLMWYGEKDE